MIIMKFGPRRIDKGSISEDITGNSVGDYYGCINKCNKDRYKHRGNYL